MGNSVPSTATAAQLVAHKHARVAEDGIVDVFYVNPLDTRITLPLPDHVRPGGAFCGGQILSIISRGNWIGSPLSICAGGWRSERAHATASAGRVGGARASGVPAARS